MFASLTLNCNGVIRRLIVSGGKVLVSHFRWEDGSTAPAPSPRSHLQQIRRQTRSRNASPGLLARKLLDVNGFRKHVHLRAGVAFRLAEFTRFQNTQTVKVSDHAVYLGQHWGAQIERCVPRRAVGKCRLPHLERLRRIDHHLEVLFG
jgi:hypothetical protein